MKFPITAKLKFDEAELRGLLQLRGRASHASSRLGVDELRTVSSDCADRVYRLKSLAEILILTKQSWGSKGNVVKQIVPILGYVLGHNKLVRFRSSKKDSA
jgi:hypothetical protein